MDKVPPGLQDILLQEQDHLQQANNRLDQRLDDLADEKRYLTDRLAQLQSRKIETTNLVELDHQLFRAQLARLETDAHLTRREVANLKRRIGCMHSLRREQITAAQPRNNNNNKPASSTPCCSTSPPNPTPLQNALSQDNALLDQLQSIVFGEEGNGKGREEWMEAAAVETTTRHIKLTQILTSAADQSGRAINNTIAQGKQNSHDSLEKLESLVAESAAGEGRYRAPPSHDGKIAARLSLQALKKEIGHLEREREAHMVLASVLAREVARDVAQVGNAYVHAHQSVLDLKARLARNASRITQVCNAFPE